MNQKRVLGKGLDALFGASKILNDEEEKSISSDKNFLYIAITSIYPNPNQARKIFDQDELNELSNSITTKGVIQPIVVRKIDSDNYQIIAGERRWRASKLAGLEKLPVVVTDYAEHEVLEVSVIENIQRSELDPLEEANAYYNIIEQFDYTQEDLAKRLGKSRSHIANSLRILKLPSNIKDMLHEKQISFGHAKVLLGVNKQDLQQDLANIIIEQNLSVRSSENMVQEMLNSTKKPNKSDLQTHNIDDKNKKNEYWEDKNQIEKQLRDSLNTKVEIKLTSNKNGKIEISFLNIEQFNYLFDRLTTNNL